MSNSPNKYNTLPNTKFMYTYARTNYEFTMKKIEKKLLNKFKINCIEYSIVLRGFHELLQRNSLAFRNRLHDT